MKVCVLKPVKRKKKKLTPQEKKRVKAMKQFYDNLKFKND